MSSGIIAGTAIYHIPDLEMNEKTVNTPYGEVQLSQGTGEDDDLYFLPRHGADHSIPPHRVNYRAHLKAFEVLGVDKILAAYAVGSINPTIPPLSLVAVNDFIDFTSGRESTYYDGGSEGVKHVDMSQPFCPALREALLERAPDFDLTIRPSGVYVASNGPRLETPAEIAMFQQWGGDVIGMTAVPECVLAKELDICFAGVGFSVNWAAGFEEEITLVEEGLENLTARLMALFIATLRSTDRDMS